MNKSIAILVLLLASTVALSQTPAIKEPKGNDDDPQARAHYEWMRLRDPATGEIPPSIREKELSFAATQPTKESLARVKSYKGNRVDEVQALAWSPRGPVNVGGRTRALAVDATDTNIILAGGVSSGMTASVFCSTMNREASSEKLKMSARTGKHLSPGLWNYGKHLHPSRSW